MDLNNLTVAIVGAGYAGATTAKALSLLGANVTVYEQAPASGEVGAGIGLRPSSMDAFRRWGMLDAITSVSTPSPSFEILTATGELIMEMEWPEKHELGLTTHLIHRRDFIDALLGVLPEGMVRFGYKMTTVTDLGERARLDFENGESVEADLVIAADGISSLVRRQIFSDKPPVFSGEHAYRAVFPIADAHGLVTDDKFRMYINELGSKLYLLPLGRRGQVSFDVTVPSDDASWAPALTRETLVAAMAGFDPRIEEVTRTLDLGIVNSRAAYDIDPVDTWHTGSVALVGDAAHAMLHHQGQGANSAVLDAQGLADALADAASVAEGLALYQARRKPITDELQRISRSGWDAAAIDDVFPGQHQDESPVAS
ncbi:MAG: NAD(P)/FAD-dependent oxidoreductase [Microbacterium sp.]|uniref:FAD-dependent oxidoreductase n=1 Tax=Microbacterium sp. TaxID=51671 RepID=UPI0026298061|nr:NAD(P)/FAD-dependent oxidoreductase [Microbacterium sp.]MCX6501782.1 NAD(P)/FAD-dependent oxidoreductase [Microbacterium sp.]